MPVTMVSERCTVGGGVVVVPVSIAISFSIATATAIAIAIAIADCIVAIVAIVATATFIVSLRFIYNALYACTVVVECGLVCGLL